MTVGRLTSHLKRGVQELAGVTGLEPAASGVTGRRSNQLSYTPFAGRRVRPGAIHRGMYGLGFAKSSRGPGRLVGGDSLELPTSWV